MARNQSHINTIDSTHIRLKNVLQALIIALTLCFSSCYSSPTPIIIYDIPTVDIRADMSTDEINKNVTTWGVKISSYLQELLNQITHKVPYIDLRKDKSKK